MVLQAEKFNSHQATALTFIRSRETHDWYQEEQRSLRILTAITPRDNIPTFSTGGILADAMGLGKTLTMISAIVSTAREAEGFSAEIDPDEVVTGGVEHRTRATLVVVTSMRELSCPEELTGL
jgi:SNF2 family DNA or RNA helicase